MRLHKDVIFVRDSSNVIFQQLKKGASVESSPREKKLSSGIHRCSKVLLIKPDLIHWFICKRNKCMSSLYYTNSRCTLYATCYSTMIMNCREKEYLLNNNDITIYKERYFLQIFTYKVSFIRTNYIRT